jgi:hypothetical protein
MRLLLGKQYRSSTLFAINNITVKKYLMLLVGCAAFSMAAKAQSADLQTPCATAGEGTAGNMTISYSIGEMVLVDTKGTSNLLVTQGILQPETITADSTGNTGFEQGEVQLYPNPTPDKLTVSFGLLQTGAITLSIFDISGKYLERETFDYTGFITKQYSLAKYAASTYVLQVIYTPAAGTRKKKGVFKIIKTN